MIITISGSIGAGKSTIAKALSERLGWPRYYMGGLMREEAARRGLSLAEFGRLCETDPIIDREMDSRQAELGQKHDNIIVEGRTSWHFIPQSLKIFVDVSEEEGSRRVLNDISNRLRTGQESSDIKTLDEMIEAGRRRKASEKIRYENYYQIDIFDRSNYDLVIDTTGKSVEEGIESAWQAILPHLGPVRD